MKITMRTVRIMKSKPSDSKADAHSNAPACCFVATLAFSIYNANPPLFCKMSETRNRIVVFAAIVLAAFGGAFMHKLSVQRELSVHIADASPALGFFSSPDDQVFDPRTRKTLVIVIGQARGSEYAFKSLYWNVLRRYDADLATYFTPASPQTVLQRIAQYNWELPEFPNWSTYFDVIASQCPNGPVVGWESICLTGSGERQFMGGVSNSNCSHPGSAGILLAFRWAVQQKLIELRLDRIYHSFVLTRADELHLCPHVAFSSFGNDSSWFPEGESYGGVSDRHYFAHRDVFMRSLNITQELICNYKHYQKPGVMPGDPNLERMIAMLFQETQIKISLFKRSFFTVKLPTDPTRWTKGTEMSEGKPFGLLIKYPGELSGAKEYCAVSDVNYEIARLPAIPERANCTCVYRC